jgi:hypothetical protein
MSLDRLQPGDLVHDRDDSDPDDAIVVSIPGATADEWEVTNRNCTLADDNPDYPEDTAAIVVVFVSELREYGPRFDPTERTEIPLDTLKESQMNHYTFPRPRLTVIESPAQDLSNDAENDTDQPTETVESAEPDPDGESEQIEETEEADPVAPPSPELLNLKDRLEESGLTVDIEESTDPETDHTLTVEKLGQTYRVRPGVVIEGDGALRSRLETIVGSD